MDPIDEYFVSSIDNKILDSIDDPSDGSVLSACVNPCKTNKQIKTVKHKHYDTCDDECYNTHYDTCCSHEINTHCNSYNASIERQQIKNNKKIKREDNLQKMLNHIESTCKIYELFHIMSSELSNDITDQINKYNIIGTSNIMKITDIEYCNRVSDIYYQRSLMLLGINTSPTHVYSVLLNNNKYVELCSIDNITISSSGNKIHLKIGETSQHTINLIVPNCNMTYKNAIIMLKKNIQQLEEIVEVTLTIQQIAEKSVTSFLKLVECDMLDI
jgi:hypothetical protein